MFSWNPCTPFSEGSCNNMAVCQKRPFIPMPEYHSLGDQNSAVFASDDTGKLTLSYKAVQEGVSRTSIITLTCEQQTEGILDVAGETQQTKYYMELKSKYACPRVGPTPQHGGEEKKGELSVGSVLCIVFFCLLAVYLAGGIAFQVFVRKESGRRIIPNISFWSKITGFIKDGILFVVRKVRGSNYTKI
ncbi:hypothetical protein CHS0354_031488 [Potamilus streckersoni]|uniref:Autophagy-related protein 27 n=1 Tax=Potamilus streckersoni TaxID=2493646 RepID=A0AAE0SH88_9BIVA|nr:hypothetical protein CHS0354_031488 [Potamilus streckersoni]